MSIEHEMPTSVSLCPRPMHTGAFYMPDEPEGAICPECDQVMVRYVREEATTREQ